jgi:hypothetical protein
MRDLLNEMAKSINNGINYPALMTALAIPDICGGLISDDGKAEDFRYIDWFNENATHHFNGLLSGQIAYFLRCSVLHQGRLAHPASKKHFDEIMFVIENDLSTHLIGIKHKSGKNFLVINLKIFCKVIYHTTTKWLSKVEQTENYKKNYKKFFKYNNQKLPWNEDGISVIAAFE